VAKRGNVTTLAPSEGPGWDAWGAACGFTSWEAAGEALGIGRAHIVNVRKKAPRKTMRLAMDAVLAAMQPRDHDPSYWRDRFNAMEICTVSTLRALERHGITEVDDPGEAIDVLAERYGNIVAGYQEWVEKNWNRRRTPVDGNPLRDLYIMGLGIGGEAGEVQELLKKHVRDGRQIDEDLLLELGDVLHYLTRIASYFGIHLLQVMTANRQKIDARHARREAERAKAVEVSHD